jgi:hypothetical protein
MNQRVLVVPTAALLALVGLVASVLNVSAQADPVSILQQFVDARNDADEAGALALVADEASYVDGSACPIETQCLETRPLRADVQRFIADQAYTTLLSPASVSGATITVRAETSNAATRAAGVDRIISEYTADVRDGKLTRLRVVQDASDPQTARFQLFQRAQLPQVAPPVVGSPLDLSVRVHDDWAIMGVLPLAVDLSPRTHDDWVVTTVASRSVLDLSPRSHDDWAMASRP